MKKENSKIINSILFLLGVILLTIGFFYLLKAFGITGLIISEETTTTENSFIGVLFTLGGLFILSRIRRKSRGQAAMEFLITYGWAILAAIIVIGVLGFWGFARLSPVSTCIVSAPLNCPASEQGANAFGLGSSGVAIEVTNNGANTVFLGNTEIVTTSGVICSISVTNQQILSPGDTAIGINVCNSPLTEGSVFDADITIHHSISGSQLERASAGTISGKVKDKISIINQGEPPPPGGQWQGGTLQGGGGGGESE